MSRPSSTGVIEDRRGVFLSCFRRQESIIPQRAHTVRPYDRQRHRQAIIEKFAALCNTPLLGISPRGKRSNRAEF